MANLSDIAKRVGLSASTVSRVLNHDSTMSVSQNNREAIFAVAAELDYMTPRGRRRQSRPQTVEPAVGLDQTTVALFHYLIPDRELADPYNVGMRIGIETAALRHKVHLVKMFPENGRLSLRALIPAAGAVIVGPSSQEDMQLLASFYPQRVYADLERKFTTDADAVESDLDEPSAKLIDDLVDRGYRRIGYIGWSESGADAYDERRTAVLVRRLRELGMFNPELVMAGEQSPIGGKMLARQLLQLPEPPDVIIAGTDGMAFGVYRAAFELGLSIPRDLGVVGFNDNPYSSVMTPSLSTIAIPAQAIGSTSVDLLVEQIRGRTTAKRVIFEGRMIWRDSTR
jgi:LacI family transcriptional regulator